MTIEPEKVQKLTIELVPSTVWYSSVYTYFQKTDQAGKWRQIKEGFYASEGDSCWICGSKKKPLEAHETWSCDKANHIQKLEAIHHLCKMCHRVKHIGLWLHTPKGEIMLQKAGLTRKDVINHFCHVNECSEEEFRARENEAFRVWNERSRYEWKQDFGKYGATLNEK